MLQKGGNAEGEPSGSESNPLTDQKSPPSQGKRKADPRQMEENDNMLGDLQDLDEEQLADALRKA